MHWSTARLAVKQDAHRAWSCLPFVVVLHTFDVLRRLPGKEAEGQVDPLTLAVLVRRQGMEPVSLAISTHDKQRAMCEWHIQMYDSAVDCSFAFQRECPGGPQGHRADARIGSEPLVIARPGVAVPIDDHTAVGVMISNEAIKGEA